MVWELLSHGGGYTSCRCFPAIYQQVVLKGGGSDAHVVGELGAGHRLSREAAGARLGGRDGIAPLERLGSFNGRR